MVKIIDTLWLCKEIICWNKTLRYQSNIDKSLFNKQKERDVADTGLDSSVGEEISGRGEGGEASVGAG